MSSKYSSTFARHKPTVKVHECFTYSVPFVVDWRVRERCTSSLQRCPLFFGTWTQTRQLSEHCSRETSTGISQYVARENEEEPWASYCCKSMPTFCTIPPINCLCFCWNHFSDRSNIFSLAIFHITNNKNEATAMSVSRTSYFELIASGKF